MGTLPFFYVLNLFLFCCSSLILGICNGLDTGDMYWIPGNINQCTYFAQNNKNVKMFSYKNI